MITTQIHFKNAKNKIPPHPKTEKQKPVELIHSKLLPEFTEIGSGHK
jgi:hypothetical protein